MKAKIPAHLKLGGTHSNSFGTSLPETPKTCLTPSDWEKQRIVPRSSSRALRAWLLLQRFPRFARRRHQGGNVGDQIPSHIPHPSRNGSSGIDGPVIDGPGAIKMVCVSATHHTYTETHIGLQETQENFKVTLVGCRYKECLDPL